MMRRHIRNQVHALTFLLFLMATGEVRSGPSASTAGNSHPRNPIDSHEISGTLNSGSRLEADRRLSPGKDKTENDFGLVEVHENEIPEGSEVYVLEEPMNGKKENGEILQTADNVVFRPLFRYRSKQEALRRQSNRYRRRYFISRRAYRQTYYPYYYTRTRYYY